tara:strand:+ start:15375 stop:17297 length:1923 start_codon:yes stop_codon:yes gene_type:complete
LRRDIQFLRGIAVLVVVFYHSNLGLVKQGYLGVDVFFVLSGFLITSIILKALDNQTFQFSEFYLRRAKRLLPALYSTLLFTTLLSLMVLTQQQWFEYLAQLKGALTFTANMVLPSQTGYFDSSSEGKPLLHIWSLSLEEQYYFLLPVFLYLLPKRFRLIGVVALALASLFLCFSWVYSENQYAPFLWRIAESPKSEWAFYLLFTRAWELLAGSICAWIMLNKSAVQIPTIFKVIALAMICFICSISINNEHPSLESVIVVLSTMVILIGNKEWLPQHFIIHFIEKAGDWSYSIYLVHWPLFAFAYLSYVGSVPTDVKILLLVSSLILGYMQFRCVETPFRIGKFKNIFSNWKVTVSATLILLAVPATSAYIINDSEDKYSNIRRTNYGLSSVCSGSFDEQGRLKQACILGDKPKVAVWGDSYAMHLVPGLSLINDGLVQITKSVCGPIIGLAPITAKFDEIWAKSCLQFNDNALHYIKNNPTITHVVLSAKLSTYVNNTHEEYLTYQGAVKVNQQLLLDAFKNTILTLKKLNIIPVVVSPPPKSGFDIGECLERLYGSTLLLREGCDINYTDYMEHQHLVNKTLKEVGEIATIVWLENYLCDKTTCKSYIDNTFIYRDEGHLSVDGSIKLLSALDVTQFK